MLRAVEIAFSGKRSISLARIASAQGQVFWPSIDRSCMSVNFQHCKERVRKIATRPSPYLLRSIVFFGKKT